MKKVMFAALAAALAAPLAFPLTLHADDAAYTQAVQAAYAIVTSAQPGDLQAAQQATAILEGGTGKTQPEIIADLAKKPPDFQDAAARLGALLAALGAPATTQDPATAQAKLHEVLSMHRYDALHRPPSALDRLGQWVQDRIRELLRALFGGQSVGGVVPYWVVYLIGALIIAAVAFVVFRSAGGRLGGGEDEMLPGAPRPPADYFAEADRHAAAGDYVLALRALCAAVAGTLAGEKTWEGSPLTVREIFSRSKDPGSLRPLLLPFEAAVYGGRQVDEVTYRKAVAAAAPYRAPLTEAAA
jgi:hypothetical protein